MNWEKSGLPSEENSSEKYKGKNQISFFGNDDTDKGCPQSALGTGETSSITKCTRLSFLNILA